MGGRALVDAQEQQRRRREGSGARMQGSRARPQAEPTTPVDQASGAQGRGRQAAVAVGLHLLRPVVEPWPGGQPAPAALPPFVRVPPGYGQGAQSPGEGWAARMGTWLHGARVRPPSIVPAAAICFWEPQLCSELLSRAIQPTVAHGHQRCSHPSRSCRNGDK